MLAVGELNPDLIFTNVNGKLALGNELLANDFCQRLGSSTAIFAAQLGSLGFKVALVSRVGKDGLGRFCLRQLETFGVDTGFVIEDEGVATGVTVSVSFPEDRLLITHLGAISRLRRSDVADEILSSAKHLHVSSFYLQDSLRPGCGDLLRRAKGLGLSVSLDSGDDPKGEWDGGIREILDDVDFFFPNKRELLMIGQSEDPAAAARNLMRPTLNIVAKLGAEGCLLANSLTTTTVPGFSVNAVDTTGAGDSFNAGFVAGLTSGLSLRECATLANACGALSTQFVGGASGLGDLRAIEEWIHQHPDRTGEGGIL